jgi:CDP-6-deoxy-D-xylo-4-hexulose-3-dehydrase
MAFVLIVASILFGYFVVSLVDRRVASLEKLFLSFPVGLGVITFLIFLGSLVTNKVYSRTFLFYFLGLLAFLPAYFYAVKTQAVINLSGVKKFIKEALSRPDQLAIPAIIAAVSLSILFFNIAWGPYDWDVITLYDFRAHVLAQDRGLQQLYEMTGKDGARFVYYFSYPLLTSIAHAIFYIGGQQQVLIIYALFFASLYSWLYLVLKRIIRSTPIAVGTLLILLFLPVYLDQAQTAYSNFPYTVYFTFGMVYFFQRIKEKRVPLLGALFMALCMWTRFVDPFYYIVLFLLGVLAVKDKKWQYLLATLPILFVRQVWTGYITKYAAPYSDTIQVFTPGSLAKMIRIDFFHKMSMVPGVIIFVEQILWKTLSLPVILLIGALLLVRGKAFKKYWLEFLWLVMTLGIINAGGILFAFVFKDWSGIPGSAERMFSSLIPLLYIMVAWVLDMYFSDTSNDSSGSPSSSVPEIKLIKSTFYNEEETKRSLQHFIHNASMLSFSEQCQLFEANFAKYQGRKYAVFVNSGSSGNLAIIQALINAGKLKKGDKVGFSALTWSTNPMPLIQLGLTPIPVDVELDTLNVSPRTLQQTLKKHKLKAFFITNLLGFCDDIAGVEKLCKQKKVIFLEDNCESLGSVYKKKMLGNYGFASSFSFYVGHHMSTVEGGMVCTDDKDFATMLRIVRAHGWDRNLALEDQEKIRTKFNVNSTFYSRYTFYDLGYNLRPTEIAGFLGNYQLRFLDEIVEKRRANFMAVAPLIYSQKEKYYPVKYEHMDFLSNFAVPVICRSRKIRDELVKKCRGKIEIRPVVGGDMTQQPFFSKHVKGLKGIPLKTNAKLIHEQGLYFGNNPELTEEELKVIRDIFTTSGSPSLPDRKQAQTPLKAKQKRKLRK